MTRRKGNVTIGDVAQLAKVVPSTVSHAINHTAPISEETRQRVVLPCELVVRESCGAHLHANWRPSRSRLRLS